MPAIIIEILVFLGFVGSIAWAAMKNTAIAVKDGVKQKLQEREIKMNQSSNKEQPQPTGFTENEKQAIIGTLYYIGMSDSFFNKDKHDCIEFIADTMEYNINLIALLKAENIPKYRNALYNLSNKNKEFFIIWVYALTQCTAGGSTQESLRRSDEVFESMELSPERVSYIIATMQHLMNSNL